MTYRFYRLPSTAKIREPSGDLSSFRTVLWKPGLFSVVPSGVSLKPHAVWWLFHHLKLFHNNDYSMLTIYDGDRLIHRSSVFPGYFRFPFMKKRDLQVGDTFTDPEYRGRGLATVALNKCIEYFHSSDRDLWYLVGDDNTPSIHVIEKAGFELYSLGGRKKRLGISAFGYYEPQKQQQFK